jgi:hypothetical protein
VHLEKFDWNKRTSAVLKGYYMLQQTPVRRLCGLPSLSETCPEIAALLADGHLTPSVLNDRIRALLLQFHSLPFRLEDCRLPGVFLFGDASDVNKSSTGSEKALKRNQPSSPSTNGPTSFVCSKCGRSVPKVACPIIPANVQLSRNQSYKYLFSFNSVL